MRLCGGAPARASRRQRRRGRLLGPERQAYWGSRPSSAPRLVASGVGGGGGSGAWEEGAGAVGGKKGRRATVAAAITAARRRAPPRVPRGGRRRRPLQADAARRPRRCVAFVGVGGDECTAAAHARRWRGPRDQLLATVPRLCRGSVSRGRVPRCWRQRMIGRLMRAAPPIGRDTVVTRPLTLGYFSRKLSRGASRYPSWHALVSRAAPGKTEPASRRRTPYTRPPPSSHRP